MTTVFVDANYFIRAMAASRTPQDESWAIQARSLFRDAATGRQILRTSEAVIAEVAFVLSSKRHFGLAPAEVVQRLRAVLDVEGLRFAQKRVCQEALDIWIEHPRIGFVDALAAAYARQPDTVLATFDAHFRTIEGVSIVPIE